MTGPTDRPTDRLTLGLADGSRKAVQNPTLRVARRQPPTQPAARTRARSRTLSGARFLMSCSNNSIIVWSATRPARARLRSAVSTATQRRAAPRRAAPRARVPTAALHLAANLLRQRRLGLLLQQIAQQIAGRHEVQIKVARKPFSLRALAAALWMCVGGVDESLCGVRPSVGRSVGRSVGAQRGVTALNDWLGAQREALSSVMHIDVPREIIWNERIKGLMSSYVVYVCVCVCVFF